MVKDTESKSLPNQKLTLKVDIKNWLVETGIKQNSLATTEFARLSVKSIK